MVSAFWKGVLLGIGESVAESLDQASKAFKEKTSKTIDYHLQQGQAEKLRHKKQQRETEEVLQTLSTLTGESDPEKAFNRAGQILTSAGAGAPPTFATPAAAGKILKVQNRFNGALTASTATSSTHFDIVAGSMTFTPTSSSSNILCILSAGMDIVSNGGNCGWSLSLSLSQSGGLAVSNDTKTEYGYYSANQAFGGQTYGQNLSFIESYANSSTNAITITGQGHNYSEGNSQTVKFQRTSLIVMEWV